MTQLEIRVYGIPAPQGGSRGLLSDPTNGKFLARHGQYGTPEHQAWVAMRKRCNSPRNASYERYGGRGIRVCPEWESFSAFSAAVGKRPGPGYSLGRIDNDGGYEPGNVRWETAKQQQGNRRTVRMLTHDGRTMPLTDWAQHSGISRVTLPRRLGRGWNLAEALTKPVDKRRASKCSK